MQTIKQSDIVEIRNRYCWYLDFSIIFGLLIVKIYVSVLILKKKWQGFDI